MTIGDRIKYLRTSYGITQSKLAELTGIHPVSIGKYEINKMTPQPQQINRIAAVLGVTPALLTNQTVVANFETVGDIMGVLIMLIKSKILVPIGDRDKKDKLIAETAAFEFNPYLARFLNITAEQMSITNIKLLPKQCLDDLLKWEKCNLSYEKCVAKYSNSSNPAELETLEKIKTDLEITELELQRSDYIINSDGGISVRILPN